MTRNNHNLFSKYYGITTGFKGTVFNYVPHEFKFVIDAIKYFLTDDTCTVIQLSYRSHVGSV